MKEKVLIVEDNPQNMRLLDMTLMSQDYRIIKATDGEQALQKAMKEMPDLIIMNIQLPKMNGLEATRRLRQTREFSHIPIIAVTGRTMIGDKERILQVGCDVYSPKPINTREFPNLVARMLPQHCQDQSIDNP